MSTSVSVISGFNQTVSEFVDTHILQTLVNYLNKEKGVSVSLDELRSTLQLTVTAPAPSPMRMPMTGVYPPSLSNFHPTTVQPNRPSKKTQPQPGAVLCQYVFRKGKNENKTCGEVNNEVAVEGSDKCKNHIDKGPKKDKEKASKDAPMSGVGAAQRAADSAKAPPVSNAVDQGQLDVYPYPNRPGYFRTKQHGFVIKQIDGNYLIAMGVEENGKIRPLTEEEKTIAYDMGICMVDAESNKTETPSDAPTKPLTIPTLPNPSTAPKAEPVTVTIPKIAPLVPAGGLVIPKI